MDIVGIIMALKVCSVNYKINNRQREGFKRWSSNHIFCAISRNTEKFWETNISTEKYLLFHQQIFFMQGLQSVETCCKFTFSVDLHKTNTESDIFADISNCKWKSKNYAVYLCRCWDADAQITRNLKRESSRASGVKNRFDVLLNLRYQHRFKVPKQVLQCKLV